MKLLPCLVALAGGCVLPLLVEAAPASLSEATVLFDQMDREEMYEALEKASNCLSGEKFQCAKEQLAVAERLINDESDRKAWKAVLGDYNAERQRLADEAQEEKRLEAAQRQAERDERENEERRADRLDRKRQEAYAVGNALMAGYTSMSAQQRQNLVEAYVADTMRGTGGASSVRAVGNQMNDEIRQNTERKRERAAEAQVQLERNRQNLEQQRADAQRSREASRGQQQAAQAEQRAKSREAAAAAPVPVPVKTVAAKPEVAKVAEPLRVASAPVKAEPAKVAAPEPKAAKPVKPVKPAEPAFQQQLRPLGTTTNARGDICRAWVNPAYPVSMEACSYSNGGSGYVRVVNNGPSAADVCWNVVYGTGGKEKGCFIKMGPGEVTEPSCFSCGNNNKGKGVNQVQLEKYQPVK